MCFVFLFMTGLCCSVTSKKWGCIRWNPQNKQSSGMRNIFDNFFFPFFFFIFFLNHLVYFYLQNLALCQIEETTCSYKDDNLFLFYSILDGCGVGNGP